MLEESSLNIKEDSKGLRVLECKIDQHQLNKFLYQFIGAQWNWTDKLSWSNTQWKSYVESELLRTWIAYYKGAIAGYFELQKTGSDVEIMYFGLSEKFIGIGMGGFLLSNAIQSAWKWPGTSRVCVHTCSLDHPSALQNYKSRGMVVYKEESVTQPLQG